MHIALMTKIFFGEFNTEKDALKQAVIDGLGKKFIYVGEIVPFKPQINGIHALNEARMQSWDNTYGPADHYLLDVTKKDCEDLDTVLSEAFEKWAHKTGNVPTFQSVINTKIYSNFPK